ncbi:MAG TPA: high-potential iron-sulfur protein [Burkholderiales bacterium]|nr:high-potential iron-sulfur protein [Burkholderiales bacterium]
MGKTRKGITRRGFLRAGAVLAGAAAVSARAQQGKPPAGLRKRKKSEVRYQDEPYLGRTCSKCVLYQGDGVCTILDEKVSPNGWCSQWVPNTMG